MRKLLIAIAALVAAAPAMAQTPSNPTITPPQITPVRVPDLIPAGQVGPNDLFVLTQEVGVTGRYVTRKLPLSQIIGPGMTNGLAIYNGPNSIIGTPLGTGVGVIQALSIAPNAAGGMALYPVPPSSLGGLGAGVAAALGADVNATGGIASFPVAQSTLSGLGSGVSTALAIGTGSAGSILTNGGALGTPSSGTLTNASGLPIGGVTGLGTGVAAALSHAPGAASGFLGLNASAFIPATPEVGITSGAAAAAGNVGEVISSDIPVGSAVATGNGATTDVTSISLSAGAWACWGSVATNPAAGTVTQALSSWLSTTSATVPTAVENGGGLASLNGITTGATGKVVLPIGNLYLNISAPTTLFLSGNVTFSISTMAIFGYEACRRVR